ncbi:MFS transporter [Stappia sp. ES.058]|uniref:MFS transporter n=1 Tax=Stappia sp. ES.058 TaxID=1881061 RepID=UPI00087B4926|nr:MFS transporter [Stappia sp. ES.058]SDU17110.1 Major Facilitator Superfamily protein [Stappia sp. ES.058]
MSYFAFVRENLRWLLAGLLLTFFSSFGQTFFISLVAGDLRGEFNLSHGEFGGLYMAATLLSAASLTVIGKVVDTHPLALVSAGIVCGLALFSVGMASVSSVAMLFVVLYGLRLFGQGMMTHVAMTAMGRWYAAQRGRAVSIAALGIQCGEASLPLAFVSVSALLGWRGAWWLGAGALVVVALPALLLLLRVERIPRGQTAPDDGPEVLRHWTRREVLRDPAFWVISAGTLAPPFIGTTIFFNQVYLVELRGWTMELFASAFVAMSSMTITCALLAGWLIDKVTAVRILPVFLLPLGAACVLLATVTHPAAAFGFMGLLGVSYGFSSTLFGSLWPEIYGTRHLGAVRSVTVAMMVLASALGPGLTGYLIDLGVPYETQVLAMAAYCFAAAAAMAVVSVRVRRRFASAAMPGIAERSPSR